MPTPEENIARLKGRYITYVCRIDDPQAWSAENPMRTNKLNGVHIVGMAVGDLMGYSNALEELVPEDKAGDMHAAHKKHRPI